MAWQIKIHTLNVGQGDAQIIEVWDEVEDNDKGYKKWKTERENISMDVEYLNLKLEYAKENSFSYKAILIDGGSGRSKIENEDSDAEVGGKYNFQNILEYCGQKLIQLTSILLTHADEDHYGGLVDLYNSDITRCYFKKLGEYIKEIKENKDRFTIPGSVIVYLYLNLYKNDEVTIPKKIDKKLVTKYVEAAESKFHIEKESEIKNIAYDKIIETEWNEKIENSRFNWILDENVRNSWGSFISLVVFLDKCTFYISQDAANKETTIFNNPWGLKDVGIVKNILTKDFLGKNIFNTTGKKLSIFNEQYKIDKPCLFVVAIDGDYIKFQKTKGLSTTPTNSSSIGLLLVYKNFTYLTCGDITDCDGTNTNKIVKNEGVKENLDLESLIAKNLNNGGYNNLDYMKIGHHGSAEGTSRFVLDNLKPKNVIISCSSRFTHGHPTQNVIKRLYENPNVKKIYLTNCAPRYGVKDSWRKGIKSKELYTEFIKTVSTNKNRYFEDIDTYKEEIDNYLKSSRDQVKFGKGFYKDKTTFINSEFDAVILNKTLGTVVSISNTKENKLKAILSKQKQARFLESSQGLKRRHRRGALTTRVTNLKRKAIERQKYLMVIDGKVNQNAFLSFIPSINNDCIDLNNGFNESKPNCFVYQQSDKKWQWEFLDMDNVSLEIKTLKATYNQEDHSEQYNYTSYTASGRATLLLNNFNTEIEVNLNLNTSNLIPYWEVSLASNTGNSLNASSLSINSLATLADKDFMPYEIPYSLTDIFENVTEGLTLNRFDGIFYANPDFSSKLNIDVSLNHEWTLIENKLSIKNIGFDLELEPDSIAGGVYGTFTIANKEVEIYVGTDTESTWAISISGKTNDNGINQPLPNLLEVGRHFINGFENVEIPFIAEKDGSNNPKLELTLIQLKVNFQAKNKIRELAVNSVITINELKFNILLHVYPSWKIKGYLDTGCRPTFGTLLTNFSLGVIDSIKDIVITKASVEANPESKFYEIELALGNVYDFEIGGKKVELVDTSVTIRSNKGNISGNFAATLMIAVSSVPKCGCNDTDYIEDTVFDIEAAYDKKWQFKGVLSGHLSLDILTNWLEDTLEVTLPKWIQNLHLKNAAIAFSTKGDYSFDLELYSNLNDDEESEKQKLVITLHISKSAGKDEFELSATVDIGYESFVAKIDKSAEKSKLLFEWQDKQPDSEITINEILADLGLKDTLQLPEAIDIGFNETAIEYETTEKSKCLVISSRKGLDYYFCLVATKLAGKWIYATKVGINSIKLHLNEIPLVGKEISEDVGVKNIVLLGLSDTLEKDSIETLNKLIEKADHQLSAEKEGLQKGAYLSMQLDLGNGNIYPIQVSTDSNKPKQKVEKLLLLGDEPTIIEEKPSITWKKIAKKVGPLQINKIGFGFQNSKLNLHFDTALIAGSLTLGLDDLELSSPITEFKPQAKLNGMSLQYISNALQIGGSFKKDGDGSYSGAALIGNKAFQLAAIGAYAKVDDATKGTTETSLFVYAMLNKDLGGPSQFYIKGIATGFGYNRYLLLPKLDDVKEYPFVAPFVSTTKSDKTQLNEKTTVTDAIKLLSDYVSPKVGQQWFVAGIKFTTYNILDSVALLALKFGTKTEIGLVGFSEINYPKGNKPLIHAQLALVASILSDEGIAAVNAQLTAESYLFTEDCKLTGGFAFYMWFGNNANSGDFVVTLGGYHPSFNVPSHYPQVPRLSFNWPITSELNIKGEMYFALTPRCIMAGGRFEANYQSGNFRAWFIMGADFMIAWKPYHYEANMYVVFGVAYQFRLNLAFKTISKNISANFGAQLQIWGPDFSGTARIDLSVISFTIRFGNAQKNDTKTIDWNEFKTDFLPEDKKQDSLQANNNSVKETTIYCSSKAISGIIAGKQREIVQLGHENVVFEISTVIPIISIDILSNDTNWEKAIGIKPAGIASNKFSSELKIEITKEGDPKNLIENFIISEKLENIAGALWNDSGSDKNMVNNALMGLYIEPKPKEEIIAVQFNSYVKDSKPKPITIYKVEQTTNLVEIDETIAGLFKEKGWI